MACAYNDPLTSEPRYVRTTPTEEGFNIVLYDGNANPIREELIRLEIDSKPLLPESLKVHQNSFMKTLVVEFLSGDHRGVVRLDKRDISVLTRPLFFPIHKKKYLKTNDMYCVLQAKREEDGNRYALFVGDLQGGFVSRPSASISPKIPHIEMASGETPRLYFLERHDAAYHLSFVDPSGEWDKCKESLFLQDIDPNKEKIILLKSYGDRILVVSQDTETSAFKIFLFEHGRRLTLVRRLAKALGPIIEWKFVEPGVLMVVCNKDKYHWISLAKETDSSQFDGCFFASDPVVAISMVDSGDDGLLAVYWFHSSLFGKIKCYIWNAKGDRVGVRTSVIECDDTKGIAVHPLGENAFFEICGKIVSRKI